MCNKCTEFYINISLLEIVTIKTYPECVKLDENNPDYIIGVDYAQAYSKKLKALVAKEFKYKSFDKIDWDTNPFKDFKILKEDPPCRLKKTNATIEFEYPSSIRVEDWGTFFRSFCQIRNNLVHGAKFVMYMNLNDRDIELISAGISFIQFLEDNKLISLKKE